MDAVGIDVTAGAAHAVAIDADGNVLRAETHVEPDAAVAMLGAAAAVKRAPQSPVGIATDDPAVVDASVIGKLSSGGRPPVVCRAADAVVYAEAWAGVARAVRHAVCFWLGDRVFAGVLLNGEPWRGAHGLAGSAAWLALNPVERQDYRKFGSFAAEVNDQGIARRLAWRVQTGDDSAVVQQAGGLDSITAAHVFEGARAADGVAISVVRDTARYIAMAAVNVAIAVDPEVVVIGGPITSAADLLQESMSQDFARRLPPAMVGRVRCEFSPLGRNAIAIGAARLAMVAHA